MAVSINSTRGAVTATRRQMIAAVGGVAAVTALATPSTAAEPLVRLWEEYQRLSAECDAADDAWMEAYRQRPEAPACLCKRVHQSGAQPYLVPLDPEELQELFAQAVKGHGTAWAERSYGPRLQAMKEWQAACDAADRRNRVEELHNKVNDLFLRSGAVLEDILNTPPQTPQGIVIWLQVMERHMPDAPSEPENEWPIHQRVMRRLLPAVRALC
jgi:hypothetical protein